MNPSKRCMIFPIIHVSSVSEACFSVLFADDTNMFITGCNVNEMCNQLNADLFRVREWLHCNKLSLNVLKTHYMIFTPRNKIVADISIIIDSTKISRVYVTKFLGVQIDSKLSWECISIIFVKHYRSAQLYCLKPIRRLENLVAQLRIIHFHTHISSIVTMFGVILTRQIWKNLWLSGKTSITGSPNRAHTEPLFYANKILNVYDSNVNIVGAFMYKCLFEPVSDVFDNYFCTNRDIHGRETRNADALYVPYVRLDVRRSSIKIRGFDLWDILPPYIHNSESSNEFKIRLRNYLIDRKVSTWCESSLSGVSWIFWSMIIFLNSNFFVRLNSKCLVENMK